MMDHLDLADGSAASLVARTGAAEKMAIVGVYHVECLDADGNVRWADDVPNLVVTVGINDMFNKYLSGSAWSTGTVYMGLKGTGTVNAADTMTSHAGWLALDITASRASVTFAAASGGSKTTSAASANVITAAGPTTVAGCFIVIGGTSANTDTTGTLFSAGDFTGGSRSVYAGDTLNVSYSVSA